MDALILTITTVAKIVLIMVPLILCVAYLTLAERRVIGSMQNRIGPNRVGFQGLGQPFADVFKLLLKEVIVPTNASRFLFLTVYAVRMSALAIGELLRQALADLGGTVECGELGVREEARGLTLPTAIFARWRR